jgi:CDP-glycerol glycerophosphotransferase (TagB/SpsB family)
LHARQAFLYIKLHRKTESTLDINASLTSIGWWPDGVDFYPYLNSFDLLITDYSSIFFDYIAVSANGAILYQFDLEDYISRDRDLAFGVDTWAIGHVACDFATICDLIDSGAALDHLPEKDLSRLREEFWNGALRLASPRLVDHLIATK